ncbi:hypothetical protein [Polyangium aurulentum]|uniref:hypothetical protein n=1 Tax=Polyangium aurulentum TaxID=2567896 RepID=UPI0010AEA245|nr:hypothetical protein [Polyangium aurulentum]UQA62564.1 hypothetical protein E8A73_019760 [Polyangium aurulentum]
MSLLAPLLALPPATVFAQTNEHGRAATPEKLDRGSAFLAIGPAVRVGGPYPYPVSMGGRVSVRMYWSRVPWLGLGMDNYFMAPLQSASLWGVPVRGYDWTEINKLCAHVRVLELCFGFGGTKSWAVINNGKPEAWGSSLLALGVDSYISVWRNLGVQLHLDGGVFMWRSTITIDMRPDQTWTPFPVFGLASVNFFIDDRVYATK